MKPEEITTIYIIRHGQSLGNAFFDGNQQKFDSSQYGELQTPLSDLGQQQATGLAQKLRGVKFDAAFSSDLNRARETAEIIAKPHSLQVSTVSTIRERNFGTQFYERAKDERKELEEALRNLNEEEKLAYKYSPDGESGIDAVNRFMTFLHEIIPLYKEKTIYVVNHGNIMRSFLIYLGWALYDDLQAGTIDNCAYFVLETDGKQFSVKETAGIHKRTVAKNNEE